jgi:type IV pilus assembly protein PilC
VALRSFHYRARTLTGELVRGTMDAPDAHNVLELLRGRALFVTAVDAQSDFAERVGRALRLGGVSRPALYAFFRSFATLVRAGVSIQRALTVTIERAGDARLGEALRSVLADVEHGAALSSALARRPRDFPPLYVAMIAAGETGGILDDVLDRLALLLEREAALQRKVQAALAYPIIVLLAATGLTIFLIVGIVPMFAQLFESFHAELPFSTQLLMRLAAVLSAPLFWPLVAGAALLSTVGVYRLGRSARGALFLDAARLGIPIAGPLMRKAICARMIRMLATLLRSGVELTAAIDTIVPVAGSARYARAFADINAALRNGAALADPLIESRLFDPMFAALVRVGEETGQLDDMLLKVAEYFENDVEAAIATLGTAIEPVLILALGGVVGFIVLSIFLPLYSLIGNLSK